MLVFILVLLLVSDVVESETVIKNLPGYSGDLPFSLETGYIGVGDLDVVQLFYYFIQSERNPVDDPLLIWLTGGPGCSAFSGLVYEIGPLQFNYSNSRGNSPTFSLNPYSWTKVASIIFVDAPVGTGFSYAETPQDYNVSDTIAASQLYTFLRKWFIAHPKFLKNPFYVTGDSYSGIIIPILVENIVKGLEARLEPPIKLQGYVIGNPVTDTHLDLNARVKYAHQKALISDEIYKLLKENCNGEYIYPDPNNSTCIDNLDVYHKCIGDLYNANILEPKCSNLAPKPKGLEWNRRAVSDDSINLLYANPQNSKHWCRSYNYIYSYNWANDKNVQDVLQIREGSIIEWTRCNESLSYTSDVTTSLAYHQKLIKKGFRVLIYSGDHDLIIPYLATHAWIDQSLNLTIADDWRPWFVDGQVSGYTVEYKYKKARLVYATVKGGGHTAPEYKPKECFAMIDRWFDFYPL